ncbi:hypothetical protein V6N12_066505 [Hibiscus sabdariffa]|uniref:CCHC-type domain-containing protein n=1 Tax=Hibiscus sabdariffa TaxID=183260 RepID=A0ABR2CQR5_9ROSI
MKPILMYGKETLDFAEIANKLISEERRLKNGGRDFTVRDSTDSVLVVNEKRKKNVVCWRCGKAGHVRKNYLGGASSVKGSESEANIVSLDNFDL